MQTKDNGAAGQVSGAVPPQVIGPPQFADPTGGMPQEQMDRLQKLLSGQVQPPNPFAEYIIQQLRETMAKGQNISQKLVVYRSQVKKLEEESLRLEGVAEQHLKDLAEWDKPLANASEVEEAPPEGEKKDEATP